MTTTTTTLPQWMSWTFLRMSRVAPKTKIEKKKNTRVELEEEGQRKMKTPRRSQDLCSVGGIGGGGGVGILVVRGAPTKTAAFMTAKAGGVGSCAVLLPRKNATVWSTITQGKAHLPLPGRQQFRPAHICTMNTTTAVNPQLSRFSREIVEDLSINNAVIYRICMPHHCSVA